ncbi:unnamed protein product [Macrosiphum euphorbiae]|uniref:Uncharacterized protein n=1 Tax=Macrosiphum euphorbiae TaxID=13131 RepID=A0AAV0VM79_9HEMI|nr:unnamed protein product [Macrosiphum euphorbiae]
MSDNGKPTPRRSPSHRRRYPTHHPPSEFIYSLYSERSLSSSLSLSRAHQLLSRNTQRNRVSGRECDEQEKYIEGDGYSEKGREIPEKTNPVESHQRLLILLVSIMSRPGATGRGEVGGRLGSTAPNLVRMAHQRPILIITK